MPGEDFRLFFDSGEGGVGASVVSYRPKADEDGYFLLLASPQIKQPKTKRQAKTVVFVVDRSGSMSGEKIEQAKRRRQVRAQQPARGRPVQHRGLRQRDRDLPAGAGKIQRRDARGGHSASSNGLYAGGSTNIDGALTRALGMLPDSKRPTYVLFLTDGLPTTGETSEAAIVKHSEEANDVRARVFAFGVGYDVNSRLLDKLARAELRPEPIRAAE